MFNTEITRIKKRGNEIMETENGKNVDWMNEGEYFENLGRSLLENSCNHTDEDKNTKKEDRETNVRYAGYCSQCGVNEDTCEPILNYVYPLRQCPSDKQILKIIKETCLTVMLDMRDDEYYLALCSGGMDLSQDIGLAYVLAEENIPFSLALEISTQEELSKSGAKFISVMEACKNTIQANILYAKDKLDNINKSIECAKKK